MPRIYFNMELEQLVLSELVLSDGELVAPWIAIQRVLVNFLAPTGSIFDHVISLSLR